MICTKCGKETIGKICIFCGAPLLQAQEDETAQKISKKKNASILSGTTKKMTLHKNGVTFFKGRQEGKDSDVNIPFKNIIQLKFVKASNLKHGFLTFCTKTGAGEQIISARKASSDKFGIVFSAKRNAEFEAFTESFNEYMQRLSPKYLGILSEEQIDPAQKAEQKKQLKEKLANYDKEKILYCPKCFNTNVSGYKKNDKGVNTYAKCKNCAHSWKIGKKLI